MHHPLKDFVNEDGQCETCGEGLFPNGEKNGCLHCQADEIALSDDSCKKCPNGYIPSTNRDHCKLCPKTLIAIEGRCDPCENPEKE